MGKVELSIGDIATRYGCELQGDPEVTVTHVASLADAGDKALAFLASAGYRELLPTRCRCLQPLQDRIRDIQRRIDKQDSLPEEQGRFSNKISK